MVADARATAANEASSAEATSEERTSVGLRAVGLGVDPAVGVEVTSAVVLAEEASAGSCDAPDADRAGRAVDRRPSTEDVASAASGEAP